MEAKKSEKVNLENKKILYFQLGLMVTLAAVLAAFEWQSTETEDHTLVQATSLDSYVEEFIPPTVIKKKERPPEPVYKLKIEDDNVEFEEIEIEIPEIDEGDEVPYYKYEEPNEPEELLNICFNPEEEPRFRGGSFRKFQEYVASHVIYSEQARNMGLQGTVRAQFIVDENGEVKYIKIIRSIDPLLDDEVIRILSESPKWRPAKQHGIPVKFGYVIPISFKLGNQ